MAANPRAAAVAALVRQEQDGFSNLVLDAELRRQKLAGIRPLQVLSSTRYWNTAAHWTIFLSSFCPRVWQSWMHPCGKFYALHWHRHAICRCLSLLR